MSMDLWPIPPLPFALVSLGNVKWSALTWDNWLRLWFLYDSVIGSSCHFSCNNCMKSEYKESAMCWMKYTCKRAGFGCSMLRVYNGLLVSKERIVSLGCCLVTGLRYFNAVSPFRVMSSVWKSKTFSWLFALVTSSKWIVLESHTGTRQDRCIYSSKWVQICSVISGIGGRLTLRGWGFCWRVHHLWRPSQAWKEEKKER